MERGEETPVVLGKLNTTNQTEVELRRVTEDGRVLKTQSQSSA